LQRQDKRKNIHFYNFFQFSIFNFQSGRQNERAGQALTGPELKSSAFVMPIYLGGCYTEKICRRNHRAETGKKCGASLAKQYCWPDCG
jgi:hypothetical protein